MDSGNGRVGANQAEQQQGQQQQQDQGGDNNNTTMQQADDDIEMGDGSYVEDIDDEGEEEDDDEEEEMDDDEEDDEGAVGVEEDEGSASTATQPEPVEEDAAVARRRAIQAIMRDTTISEQEKRLRIQNLMSGGRTQIVPPPAPILPTQQHHMQQQSNGDPQGADGGDNGGGGGSTAANAACVHYERNCNIVAPCCNRVFGCRICHDELSPTGHPPMNRFMVREVVCKNCNTRQPASNQCIQCQTVFGEYHCGHCNLWMSMSKKPFHCQQCGFCRVGGVEAFRHCNECCMCISVTVFETHQCFKDKYKNNCPVCHEDMFSSRQSPQDLPCGHAIHAHCFRKLAGFDYRCPICKKTVVSPESMAAAWEARARDIAEHPMPADLQRVVDIMCNDCETRSHRRQWHFLGIQCPSCSSFNTVVEQVLSSGNENGTNAVDGSSSGNNNTGSASA